MTITMFLSVFIVLIMSSAIAVANPLVDRNVSNRVTAEDNGLAALARHQVNERGVIQAGMRTVPLTTGHKVALSFTSDELIGFALGDITGSSQTNQSPARKMAIMATSASMVLDRMINMNGLVQAHTATLRNGQIVLVSITGR